MISIQIHVCPQTPVDIGYNLMAFIADKWERQRFYRVLYVQNNLCCIQNNIGRMDFKFLFIKNHLLGTD